MRYALFILIAAFLQSGAFGGEVHLDWRQSVTSTVKSYMVYYGTIETHLTEHIEVGNQTYATVTGLITGQTYFFRVKSVDKSGLVSLFSNSRKGKARDTK